MQHCSYSDLEISQKTKAQENYILTGHSQSLNKIYASYHFPKQDIGGTGFMHL